MTTTHSPTRSGFAPLLAAVVILGAPIVAGVAYLVAGALGFVGNAQPGALQRVLSDSQVWRSFGLSLWIATAGTTLALLGALLICLLIDRPTRGDRLARAVATLPLPIPLLATAVAILLLLSQSGWLARVAMQLHLLAAPGQFPELVYDRWAIGVITAIIWKELPFLLLVALSLQSLRGRALADAARTLGATRWQTARRVTLPLLLRGLSPSVLAVFVFVFGSLELPMVLAPSSPLALPLLIQERRQALDAAAHGEAYVIALAACLLSLVIAVLHEWLRATRDA